MRRCTIEYAEKKGRLHITGGLWRNHRQQEEKNNKGFLKLRNAIYQIEIETQREKLLKSCSANFAFKNEKISVVIINPSVIMHRSGTLLAGNLRIPQEEEYLPS